MHLHGMTTIIDKKQQCQPLYDTKLCARLTEKRQRVITMIIRILLIVTIVSAFFVWVIFKTSKIQNVYAVQCDSGFITGPSKVASTHNGIVTWQPIDAADPDVYLRRKMNRGEICYRYDASGEI